MKWNVMGRDGKIYETSDEIAKTDFACLIRPHMFPPEESVAKELNLDRCIRILPHHQNTGGFFIALIRKRALASSQTDDQKQTEDAPTTVESTTTTSITTCETAAQDSHQPPEADVSKSMKAPPAKRLKHVWLENPFQFFESNQQLLNDWPKIK